MKRNDAFEVINAVLNLRESADDQTAARNVVAFPQWRTGMSIRDGDRIKYGGRLYKAKSEHITQADWIPSETASLYEPIDVEHGGTVADPIPAAVGMTYFYGKYYSDGGALYLCNRADAAVGVALHYLPSELVGIYFEKID